MLNLSIKIKNGIKYFLKGTKGNGITEAIIVIAAALIIGGLIMIPGFKTLGTTMVTQVRTWWNTLASSIFSAT